jgi:predicted phosphodiesterase
MKILVFSDSHKVNNQMTNILNTVKYDFAIHLGDSCENENFMKKYFKYYVGGNNDFFGKDYEIIKIKNFRFLLTHGHYEYSFNYDK